MTILSQLFTRCYVTSHIIHDHYVTICCSLLWLYATFLTDESVAMGYTVVTWGDMNIDTAILYKLQHFASTVVPWLRDITCLLRDLIRRLDTLILLLVLHGFYVDPVLRLFIHVRYDIHFMVEHDDFSHFYTRCHATSHVYFSWRFWYTLTHVGMWLRMIWHDDSL